MRPQHITAENFLGITDSSGNLSGFNEAAAYHCGKRAGSRIFRMLLEASMRPQHITAENEDTVQVTGQGAGLQ